jgi:acetolactate synthase-1/2/3 large subunit
MGWGLPAAIGASLSAPGRQVICLVGDGGLMFNVQELHTIATRKLPIAIFVYCNEGYATMRLSQNNHFKREAIAGPLSGNPISFDQILNIAEGFGLLLHILELSGDERELDFLLNRAKKPIFVAVKMDPNEVIAPRVQPRMENGKFLPSSLSHMT